jgi:WD repeat-containing protein 53
MSRSAGEDVGTPVIHSLQLTGHQGQVLCLDYLNDSGGSSKSSTLISGSEDTTCRIWDLRERRSCLCVRCPGEVLSVAFGPIHRRDDSTAAATTGQLLSPFAHEYSIYAAVENTVYRYDLRKATSPILDEPSSDLSFLDAAEEINQIAFAPIPPSSRRGDVSNKNNNKNKGSHYCSMDNNRRIFAAVEDAGSIRLTSDFDPNQVADSPSKRVLCHGPDAMVTSLAFCPSRSHNKKQQSTMLLASGGTDCRICFWDLSKTSNDPVSCITVDATDVATNQVCNPPMVHSLAYSPSGRLLAAGIGDGSVGIFHNQRWTARLDHAHAGSLASVLFPGWSDRSSAVAAHDRLLCTAGNDGCIALWDLGALIGGDTAEDPAKLWAHPTRPHPNGDLTARLQTSLALQEDELGGPKTLFALQHTAKPNWIVSSPRQDPVLPSSLFVADITSVITVYSIPLQ